MPKTCKYYCEQCGDCLECYQDIECFYGADHTIELQHRLQEQLLEKEKENDNTTETSRHTP